jgi:hypothetical protein
MKRIYYLKNVFVLVGICIFCSCNSYKYHKITIAIDDACNLEQQYAAYEVINKRIASIWRVKEKTDLTDGKFDLTYSGENSLLTQILQQKGEVYITEMFLNSEIRSPLNRVYERLFWLIDNTDHKPLWRPNNLRFDSNGFTIDETSELISVEEEQVSFIDSIFNLYKHWFPANISFAWTAKPIDGFFHLLALKSTPQQFPLNPNSVQSCKIESHKYKVNGLPLNYQEILITLEENYSDEWARLTRRNIGRNLAIVMDEKVLMFPRVQSEIINGKMGITGNYENSEYLLIKSVILGGTLDCKAQITNPAAEAYF